MTTEPTVACDAAADSGVPGAEHIQARPPAAPRPARRRPWLQRFGTQRFGTMLTACLVASMTLVHGAAAQPVIGLDPDRLSIGLQHGQTGEREFVISNTGTGPLEWALDEDGTTPGTLQAAGLLDLGILGNAIRSALIDPAGRYAYVGGLQERRLAKIDLATFEQVATLPLPADGILWAAAIDPDGRYGYWGTFTAPGRIYKVDLDSFEVVDTLDLADGENRLMSAVIDPDGGFAYFGTYESPGRVVKVDLGTFERVGALTLPPEESYLNLGLIDANGGFAYFAVEGAADVDRVVKIDLANFSRVGILALTTEFKSILSGAIDPNGGFAYFGLGSSPAELVKVDLASFQVADTLALQAGENAFISGVVDAEGRYGYFGFRPNGVAKVDLAAFERVETLALPTAGAGLSAILDPAGEFAYFGTNQAPAQLARVRVAQRCELPDWAAVGPSGGVLAAGASQTVDVGFAAGTLPFGKATGAVCIDSNDPAAARRSVALELDVLPLAAATVAPSRFDFVLPVNIVGTDVLSIANVGGGDVAWDITEARERCDTPEDLPEMSLSRSSGTTPEGATDQISLTVDASMLPVGGVFDGLLCVTTDIPAAPPFVVPYTVTTLAASQALIELDPGTIAANLAPGGAGSVDLTIGNLSLAPADVLDWSVLDQGTSVRDFHRVAATGLNLDENALYAAVVDPVRRYAYFGTSTQPRAQVIRVDLDTGERVDAITLEYGEALARSAVIDPSGRFAYFGMAGSVSDFQPPGAKVVKIDLETFERVGSIAVGGNLELHAAAIDPAGRFAYFGSVSSPARILKIDLATFTLAGELVLTGMQDVYSALIDPLGRFGYFSVSRGGVIKVDLASFQHVASLGSGAGNAGVIDPDGRYAYLVSANGTVSRIDLGTFQPAGSIVLESAGNTAVIDPSGRYAYFGSGYDASPGYVHKIDLDTFARAGSARLAADEGWLTSGVFDPASGDMYFGTNTFPGRVVRVRDAVHDCALPDWLAVAPESGSVAGSASQDVSVQLDAAGLASGTYAANVCIQSNDPDRPVAIVPVELEVRTIDVAPGALAFELFPGQSDQQVLSIRNLGGALLDYQVTVAAQGTGCGVPAAVGWLSAAPDYASIPGGGSAAVDVSVDASGLAPGAHAALLCVETEAMDSALFEVPVTLTVIDLPPAIRADPGNVASTLPFGQSGSEPLSLSNLGGGALDWSILQGDVGAHRKDALMLADGEEGPASAVVDAEGRFAYYGMDTSPGRVVKVDLSTSERVGAIVLEAGENRLGSAVIDPAGRFAYFGTNTAPAQVVKIDLATFQRVGAITAAADVQNFRAAVIDPAGAFAYFGTQTMPGRVAKLNLASFQWAGVMTLPGAAEVFLSAAVIDPAGRFAYFGGTGSVGSDGTTQEPTPLTKIDLASFQRVGVINISTAAYGRASAAVIDAQGHFAYIGVTPFEGGGEVVKVDLATARRVGAVTLNGFETNIDAAVIDPQGRFAYVSTSRGALTRLVELDLVEFRRRGTIQLNIGEDNLYTGVIDPAGRFAYFGAGGSSSDPAPARIVRIDAGQICTPPDWLTVSPASGSVAGGAAQGLDFGFDAAGLAPGAYASHVCIASNDPAEPLLTVPVQFTVELPAHYATVEGTVTGSGHCGIDPAPLAGATVHVVDGTGAEITAQADVGGVYRTWLPASTGPLDVSASASGHLPDAVQDVAIAAGTVVTQDFALTLDAPCATVDRSHLAFDLFVGEQGSQTLTIGNIAGAAALAWEIGQAPARAANPRAHFPAQVRTFASNPGARLPSPRALPANAAPRAGAGRPLARGVGSAGVPAFGIAQFTWDDYVSLDASDPASMASIAEATGTIYALTFIGDDFSRQFFIASTPEAAGDLQASAYGYVDTTTGIATPVGMLTGGPTGNVMWSSAKWDPTSGQVYVLANSRVLYRVDPQSGAATAIGTIAGPGVNPAAVFVSLAIAPDGLVYGLDILDDVLVAIDKTTAEARAIGPLGVDAAFAQDMDFDPFTGTLYWAGMSGTSGADAFGAMYTVDPESGAASLVEQLAGNAEVITLSIAQANDGCALQEDLPWLSVSPVAGTAAAGGTSEVMVSVDASGLAAGTHEAVVCVSSNDTVNRRLAVPVTLTVSVDPDAPQTLGVVDGSGQNTRVETVFETPLTVEVRNGNGQPLQGVAVNFAAPTVGASASLSAAGVATDAQGRASVTATANGQAGSYAVTASVAGIASVASFQLRNVGTDADVGIAIGAVRDTVVPGQMLDYLLVLDNAGPSPATAATLASELAPELDSAFASWLCIGPSGSGCTAQGTGDLAEDGLGLPVGGRVSWLLSAPVRLGAEGTVETFAQASHPDDPDTTNNRASARSRIVLQLFADGFEAAVDGLARLAEPLVLDSRLALAWSAPDRRPIETVLVAAPEGSDAAAFRVERLYADAGVWARLVATGEDGGEYASAWLAVPDGSTLEVALTERDGQRTVWLRGTEGEQALPLLARPASYWLWSTATAHLVTGDAE